MIRGNFMDRYFKLINIGIIILLIIVPYCIFGGKFLVGGDDSHLFYIYPELWIKNVANSSWLSFSSLGSYSVQYFLTPILLLLALLKKIGISVYVIQNSIFSFILISGLIFFQKLFAELVIDFKKFEVEGMVGSFVYVFSPILLCTPLRAYLANIWLLSVIPMLAYFFIRYFKTNKLKYLIICGLISCVLSLAFNAIPWLLGFIIPLVVGIFAVSLNFKLKELLYFSKKGALFIGILILVQLFWILPFLGTIVSKDASLGTRIFDARFSSSFENEVSATAKFTSIIDPLLNLFHRNLQSNFRWPSYRIYENWYNKFIFLDFCYIGVVLLAFFLKNNARKSFDYRIYLGLLIGFLVSLFLFTVNIGEIGDIFLELGSIPGFVMFRNFYDKFAIGYVMFYSLLVSFSLVILSGYFKSEIIRFASLLFFVILTLINAVPLFSGDVIVDSIRNTKDVKNIVSIPSEYVEFMEKVGLDIPQFSNILSMPFGESSTSIIKDQHSSNVFAGKSPVKLFSGVNDFSGTLSFPADISELFKELVIERKYNELRNFLKIYNINYIVETENIPKQILESHLYSADMLSKFDKIFHDEIFGDLILESKNGNYKLYKVRDIDSAYHGIVTAPNVLLSMDEEFHGLNTKNKFLLNILDDGDVLVPRSVSSSAVLRMKRLISGDKLNGDVGVFLSNPRMGPADIFPESVGEFLPTKLGDTQSIIYQGSVGNELTYNIDVKDIDADLSFSSWKRGDCAQIDSLKSVDFEITGSNQDEIDLIAQNGHNACINKTISVNNEKQYQLSFDYLRNANSAFQVYVDYGDGIPPLRIEEPALFQNWNHFEYQIIPPFETKSIRIYLYSGSINSGMILTKYRGIRIGESDRRYWDNFLVSGSYDMQNRKVPIIKKITSHKYEVLIKDYKLETDLFLNFKENFHSGWKIYPYKNNQSWFSNLFEDSFDFMHFPINSFSNGWLINVSQENADVICDRDNKDLCDLHFIIEFFPQRWFYLGLLISGLTLSGCVIYLFGSWVKFKRFRRNSGTQ